MDTPHYPTVQVEMTTAEAVQLVAAARRELIARPGQVLSSATRLLCEALETTQQRQANRALTRNLAHEDGLSGGSLMARPLLQPIPPEPTDQDTPTALLLAVNDLTDTAARLGAQLESGLGSAQATGKALAGLYRQLGRVAGQAEALYGAGELGGWVLGALADPEGQA